MPKLTGLSLSLCINDIVAGRVHLEDIEKIVAQTQWRTDDDWANGLENYQRNVWKGNKDATRIALLLKEQGKIEQPRLSGADPVQFAAEDSHWADAAGKSVVLTEDQAAAAKATSHYRMLLDYLDTHKRDPDEQAKSQGKMRDDMEGFGRRN